MPVTTVTTDPETLTLTVVADFAAPVRRVWDAYLDPRRLERFWGPPGYPAVFTRHDGCVGGRSEYRMTGPGGEVLHGYWEWVAVDELKAFEVRDAAAVPGYGDAVAPAGATSDGGEGIARMAFTFEATADGSRVTTTTHFDSVAALERLLALGMEQGLTDAIGQLDAVLADLASFAAGVGTQTQVLGDTQIRVSRTIRGSVAQVWQAHHDRALLQRWLLGPEGWSMPVCELAGEVGATYRYEWAHVDGERRFGFTGTLLESLPPHRSVVTERMIGADGPSVVNELTLTALDEGTLLSLLITFPDAEVRDAALATGMTDGMEASYARLEAQLGAAPC